MKIKFLPTFFILLLLMLSSNRVFAAEYESLKNTVVLPGTVNEIGGIVGHYIAGQLQQGDILTFKLPMGSFWTRASIDTDESTAMICLQTDTEWGTVTLPDNNSMRYGTDYNYILVPATYAGNPNGLFDGANPILEVSSFSKGEVLLKVVGVPDNSKNCCLYLYSNRVYIADDITGNISIEIDSPSNQALNASIPGGDIPASINLKENDESLKEAVKPSNAEKAAINPTDDEQNTKTATSVKFQIGHKQISINGNNSEIAVAPYISRDRAYVPLRTLAESLGINDITWKSDMITIKQESKLIGIDVKRNIITINDHLAYFMDTPVEITESGYSMVPARYIVQALGADINWNSIDNTIIITKSSPPIDKNN